MELDTKIILVIAVVAFSTIQIGEAFGEQHNFTNTLPNYLEI